MAYSEDHIVMAAEYALGTLDAAERSQVETMMAVDRDYAAVVQAWEFRLGPLNQMVGLVEPRAELWERIKAEIAGSRATAEEITPPAPLATAEPAAPVAPELTPAAAPEAPLVVTAEDASI